MFDDDMLYYDVDSACTSVNIQVPSVGGMDRLWLDMLSIGDARSQWRRDDEGILPDFPP